MAEYASNAKANAALTTGIIGTALGALSSAGGIAGILGFQPGAARNENPDEKLVTRYEMGLIQENTLLKAQQYADNRANGLQQQLSNQAVWNATQEGILRSQQQQLAQLYSMTKLVIPNGSVAPGWGPVYVEPGFPPVANSGTATSTNNSGN